MDLIGTSDNLKMKKRSDELIIAQILHICENGALKTRVTYQANLNYNTVNRYLNWLLANGMITKSTNGSRAIFKTTFDGNELKNRINRLHKEMDQLLATASNTPV